MLISSWFYPITSGFQLFLPKNLPIFSTVPVSVCLDQDLRVLPEQLCPPSVSSCQNSLFSQNRIFSISRPRFSESFLYLSPWLPAAFFHSVSEITRRSPVTEVAFRSPTVNYDYQSFFPFRFPDHSQILLFDSSCVIDFWQTPVPVSYTHLTLPTSDLV